MLWFWFVVAIIATLGTIGSTLLRRGSHINKADPYAFYEGFMLSGGILLFVAVILTFVIASTFIDRTVSHQACEKKDTYSTSSYRWVDYHYFSYECMLITPAGNITEHPVLPYEDVGGDR